MPTEWFAAVKWTVTAVCTGGRVEPCRRCGNLARTHLCCTSCSAAFCRSCLEVDRDAVWEIGFECAGCIVDSLCYVEVRSEHERVIMELSEELIRTRSHILASSTWRGYQRCFKQLIQFMRDTMIWAFPVFDYSHARGLCLFFQSLKMKGLSWATMSHYRCAIVSASKSIGMTSPWDRFPQLEELSAGLSRELRRPVRRKEGLTQGMLLRVLARLEARYLEHREGPNKNQRLADVALRDMAALVISWFGMRRGAELWLNRSWSMGLRRCHLTFVPGSHVTIFIQSQKNDPFSKGSEVVLAWVSGSGVCIGDILQLLQDRLDECGIPMDGPLFCATTSFKAGGFVMPGEGKEARFQHRLRVLLQKTYVELASDIEMLNRFGWHSLRRGGAQHSFCAGKSLRLIMGHAGWKTERGMDPYVTGNLDNKLTVSLGM